jgi:hypothetical protein
LVVDERTKRRDKGSTRGSSVTDDDSEKKVKLLKVRRIAEEKS